MLKLLDIGCNYRLNNDVEPPLVTNHLNHYRPLLPEDLFLVLSSRCSFYQLSNLTKGDIITNEILLDNEVWTFWYWVDSDFYDYIDKYLTKVI